MVNFYRNVNPNNSIIMDTLHNIWENYTSYTEDFNIFQKAIISAVLAFIIFTSGFALFLLVTETF